ncbi:MAG: hypoxanthine phosphoribosyltransferase [Phycisphaeraceae bacterium]
MQGDIERVLIDRGEIARRLDALADEVSRDLTGGVRGEGTDGEITLVPILTGSIIFVADLMRRMPQRMRIHLLSVASYPGKSTTSRGSAVKQELTNLPASLAGQNVLLVDDILDSGGTLKLARELLSERGPASLRTCVLLRKQRPEAMACPVDYVAFDIPDEFVVGYGLDYDDLYRNLPEIVTLKRGAIDAEPA